MRRFASLRRRHTHTHTQVCIRRGRCVMKTSDKWIVLYVTAHTLIVMLKSTFVKTHIRCQARVVLLHHLLMPADNLRNRRAISGTE